MKSLEAKKIILIDIIAKELYEQIQSYSLESNMNWKNLLKDGSSNSEYIISKYRTLASISLEVMIQNKDSIIEILK